MLKTKDGYAKLIGTTYQGDSKYLLLSDGTSTRISELSVNYASIAGNANTLDWEHANDFVRAGTIESSTGVNLDNLSIYSFIKSVYSGDASTSPKGNIGWYNVIQAVHRNGADDGPDYIGQVALGMTVNTDDMFFRTKRYKDLQNPWNPWRTVLHDGNSSISGNTIKINNTTLTVANFNHNHNNVYLKLAGGYMNTGARIGVTGGDLYIGDPDNEGWLYVQDIASQDSTNNNNYWQITTDGYAKFEYITIRDGLSVNGSVSVTGNISVHDMFVNGQVRRDAKNSTWQTGRNNVLLRETSADGYHALWSLKTTSGSWEFGEYSNQGDGWDNIPLLTYITDDVFNNGPNGATYQIRFPLASGTVALTSQISNADVNTAQYLRSLGKQNCQTGRTQAWGDVYSYNTGLDNTGAPTTYTSVIGFGRGIAGTVEIAGGWCNTGLYWRSLRDCCEDWYSWRTVLDDSNYTEFVDNYYWANVKISTTSSTTTSPTVSALVATNSIKVGNIYLQNNDEINTTTSNLHINYRSTYNVNICHGGGSVIIGSNVNDVNNNILYVNGTALLNGLVTNRGGILPASYNVNNNGTACYVWGDAMSTGVTAITDALNPRYVTVNYSCDNGTTWTDYSFSNYDKFSLYANNGNYNTIKLGQGRTPDSNGTPSLAQVQKNQLMVTFEIPDDLYSQLCWASVDVGEGISTVCTVEMIGVSGAIKNTFTKTMYGWNQVNYINFWAINSGPSIGHNDIRFVRFKFKHDASNTTIRNASIRKIRLFSFTKYGIDTSDFRSIMGNTGHLYKYDENLNVTFPNTLKTTALEVSGNASFYDLYCKTLNHPSSTGILVIGDETREVGIRSSNNTTLNALYLHKELSSNVCYTANQGFCIQPIWSYITDRLTVGDYTYGYVKVEGGITKPQTISCIIHSTAISNVRGLLIDFARGMDGQILILKNITNNNLYIRPLSCKIILPDSSGSYLTSGIMDTIIGKNSSHFFVYSEAARAWMWFRCN